MNLPGLEIAGEAKAAMHDVNEMKEDTMDDETLKNKNVMLNKDQHRVFDMITKHLSHQRQHELKELNRKPFQLFMSGRHIIFNRNYQASGRINLER